MSKKDNMEIVPKYRFPEFVDSWEIKPFKKYIKLYRGSSPRPIKDYITKNEGINWIKISDASSNNFYITNVAEQITEEGAKKSRLVEKGELILANSMSFGATYEVGISGCIYDGWFVLREYENNFIKKFLLQQLNSYEQQKQYSSLSAGGVVKNISSNIVYETILKRPSIKEQQKIADCLSSIDDLISAEEKKLSLLNDYKKGWMQKLFPAEGKTVPEWKFPEFKDDNNWKCVEIDTVGKVITGKTPPTSNDSLWNGSIQFVTPTDIVGDKYQRLVQRTVVKTSNMKVLPKGTIMFTCIASIGKMAISVYPSVTNQQINSIITKNGYYNEFIYYSMFHNVNKIKSGISNTTVPIINKTDFSKIQISVTLNEKEQQKIANFLSGIDELISSQKGKIEKLKQHKKALMQGLFPAAEEVCK